MQNNKLTPNEDRRADMCLHDRGIASIMKPDELKDLAVARVITWMKQWAADELAKHRIYDPSKNN